MEANTIATEVATGVITPVKTPEFMTPMLDLYGKELWVELLRYLDSEKLSPADYTMLEQYCACCSQLRAMSEQLSIRPFCVNLHGMLVANPLQRPYQLLLGSTAILASKMRVLRGARQDGEETSKELLDFIRGNNVK